MRDSIRIRTKLLMQFVSTSMNCTLHVSHGQCYINNLIFKGYPCTAYIPVYTNTWGRFIYVSEPPATTYTWGKWNALILPSQVLWQQLESATLHRRALTPTPPTGDGRQIATWGPAVQTPRCVPTSLISSCTPTRARNSR